MRVLLVEDDHLEARHVISALLRAFPLCEIKLVQTEHEFRDHFESIVMLRPDVILIDLMLRWSNPSPEVPDMPEDVRKGGYYSAGARCCKTLTSDTRIQQTPIVIYSAADQRALDGATSDLPETVFSIRKDRDEESLIRLLRSVLRNHKEINAQEQNKVFVVHGHDVSARETVARFLERLGLQAIVLQEQPNRGQTIIEKFERHSGVDFAVVLLTSDDVGASAKDPTRLNPRARQNAIFELGFFIAKLGRNNVCALYEPGVEIPSDYTGVLFIPIDTHGAWKLQLTTEMKAVGIRLDFSRIV